MKVNYYKFVEGGKQMKVNYYKSVEGDIEVTEITLLTVEEARMLPEQIREYEDWWWLRSPGCFYSRVAGVRDDGSVYAGGADRADI